MVVVAGGACLICRNSIPGSTGGYVAGSSVAYENQALAELSKRKTFDEFHNNLYSMRLASIRPWSSVELEGP